MTRKKVEVATLYTLFAAFSTVINICVQMISIWLYKGLHAVEVSVLVGTVISFPLRYFLEKRYIFAFMTIKISQDGQLFVLYGLMSIFTTAIFWIVEYIFQLVWGIDTMRYIGGIIGLMIGFYFKYYLDKKYVFIEHGCKVKL
jgi:hypothetical protein